MAVLEIKDLSISCDCKQLVKKVSFSIEPGECFALIGESGSDKSITSSTVGRLLAEGLSVSSGEVNLLGEDVLSLGKRDLQKLRGEKVAYIFQNYQGSFTPFIKIGKQMDEMLRVHNKGMSKDDRKKSINHRLESVGLEGKRIARSYPTQLSGGQLQRAAIAQAMLLKPRLLIADEPTTALDSVSTSVVLDLLKAIKEEHNVAILFITHDLRCVKKYADRMAIMYKGKIVETGETMEVVKNPRHAYSKNLFSAIPPLRDVPERLPVLEVPEDMEEDKKVCCHSGKENEGGILCGNIKNDYA